MSLVQIREETRNSNSCVKLSFTIKQMMLEGQMECFKFLEAGKVS